MTDAGRDYASTLPPFIRKLVPRMAMASPWCISRYGRHDRCGRFNWNGLLLLSALTPRFRCRRLRRPYPRPFAPLLLAFPRLPVTHFPQTFRGLTAGLIRGGGEKRMPAPFSYTIPRWKARSARRTRIVGAKFHAFHGKSCSPWICPNGCSEPFGHFFEVPLR